MTSRTRTDRARCALAVAVAAVAVGATLIAVATVDDPDTATPLDAGPAAGIAAIDGPPIAEFGPTQQLRTTLQRDADALLAQGAPGVLARADTPSGPVLVRSGFGDVERQQPVPWDTRFRIGSFTKPFVAAVILQLVGEGRLYLEDPVERWLPGLVRGNGNDGRAITVRQLLQHTSGLPDYVPVLTYLFDREGFERHRFDTVTPERAVELAMRSAPRFPPGSSWTYSNTNYMVAGLIIERVTGQRWSQEVQDRIVRPLDLEGTSLPGTSPDIPGPHAVGYERFPRPGATPEDPGYGDPIDATAQNPSWGGPAGEMISTTEDGNRFLQALVRGDVVPGAQLIEMLRTVPTSAELQQNWPGARYGLGLIWVPNSCGGSWSHGGDILGFMTRNGVSPNGARSVIVSINTDSLRRAPGMPAPEHDVTGTLVDHALCGPVR